MPPANAAIDVSYAESDAAPPLDSPAHTSRSGMSYATSTGSLSAAAAAPAYAPVALPMSPLQSPNQSAIGSAPMSAAIAAARPSVGWAAAHCAAGLSGSA